MHGVTLVILNTELPLESDRWIADDEMAAEHHEMANGMIVPGPLWARLYGYQQTALVWMWELHCNNAGGILGAFVHAFCCKL